MATSGATVKQTSEGNGWERVLVDQGQLPGKESLVSRRGAPGGRWRGANRGQEGHQAGGQEGAAVCRNRRREASELGMWPLQTAPVLGGDTGKRLRLEEMQNEHLKISADENAPPNTTRSRREQHNPAHSVNCPHRALL